MYQWLAYETLPPSELLHFNQAGLQQSHQLTIQMLKPVRSGMATRWDTILAIFIIINLSTYRFMQ